MPAFPRIDNYTQFFGIAATSAAAADQQCEFRIPLPRYVFGQSGTRTSVVVWEFLGIDVEPPYEGAAVNRSVQLSMSTASHAGRSAATFVSRCNEGDNIFYLNQHFPTAGTTSDFLHYYATGGSDRIELQGHDGRGFIVVTDDVYLQLHTVNFDIAPTIRLRVFYRFVRCPLSEYVGVLQQQQIPGLTQSV